MFTVNTAYIIAILLFAASGGYVYTSFMVDKAKPRLRWDMFASNIFIALSAFFYGLMTISENAQWIRLFWAAGFISCFLFLPAWIRFTSNMIIIKNRFTRFAAEKLLILVTAGVSVLCVFSDNAAFKQTRYGNQFTYNGSLLFKFTAAYVLLLCVCIFASHIKWFLDSETKRQKRQQQIFLIITFAFAPLAFITDFFVPAFTNATFPPLVTVFLLPASFQLFFSMKSNRTLNITMPNVAEYIIKSSNIPTLVLDYKNNVCITNNAAALFFGKDISNTNITELILINGAPPPAEILSGDFDIKNGTVLTESGEKSCDITLTAELDKFNEALCKIVVLRDVTESNYRGHLLQAENTAASYLLNTDIASFDAHLLKALETLGRIAKVDLVYICKNRVVDDERYYSQLYEWHEGAPVQKSDMYAHDINYADFPPEWEKELTAGRYINIMTRDMTGESREYAYNQGILSVLIVPMFIDEKFWGFVSFNDCTRERIFTNEEETVLHSSGLLFANALLRYEMEREIEKANRFTKLMLDATPLCCELWDENLNIIDCNEATLKFFGIKDKQTYIDGFYNLSPEYQPDGMRSDDKVLMCIKKAFDEGSFSFEWIHLFLDGRLVPVEATLVPVENNNIIAVYLRDLRETKAAEKQLRESMERERDLEIQKQTAQAANDAKTQFLASMSHEIRTPMNAIIGMSDLLLSEDLNARQHRYAEDIKISSGALLEIINDILDLSKIQSSKLVLSPVHYNFKMFIENINAMTLSLINNKLHGDANNKINFSISLKGDIPDYLYGDDVRFRQILLNILGNAVKYTKSGDITLTIDTKGPEMLLTVTDTGLGIPGEYLPTLFEAFEQVKSEETRYVQGTGLGLTITKFIVGLMGGEISVTSEVGTGTSFHIVLPMTVGDKTLNKQHDDMTPLFFAPNADILVVDDRAINLHVICGLLERCKIKADTAFSGERAIEMVSAKPYDLIFMDHMMPGMDGVEAAKIIRGTGIKTPIIALTANAVTGAKEFLLSAGMDDFISKPIDKTELCRVLREWLPREKVFLQSAESPARNENNTLLDALNKIHGLSTEKGLDIVAGHFNTYKSTLEILMREINKNVNELSNFLNEKDMENFCILAHGLKGSLSLVGADGLSAKARSLENASQDKDIDFCKTYLREFTDELLHLRAMLEDAFNAFWESRPPYVIPPALPPVLNRLSAALQSSDYSAVYAEMEILNALSLPEALKDEIENLNSAAMIMNYKYAEVIIERLK